MAAVNVADSIISITASGSVEDATSNAAAPSFDIVAQRLEISAQSGIGSVGNLETNVAQLLITNQNGRVAVENSGALEIERLRANGNVRIRNLDGDILLNNTADNSFVANEGDALNAGGLTSSGYGQADIYISAAHGNIFASGPQDIKQPEVVGRNVTLEVENKDFAIGSQARALVVYASDTVLYLTKRGVNPTWPLAYAPADYVPEQALADQFDAGSIAGEQLVEVEEIDEIDPAIFTAVTNYFFDDISIRLPDDQLYEDELDELAAAQ